MLNIVKIMKLREHHGFDDLRKNIALNMFII